MISTLEGQFLIAMPNMEDGRFEHSVIYICSHTEQGAMGLVLNQIASHLNIEELFHQLNITSGNSAIRLPPQIRQMSIHKGGPVEVERGFVLHTNDYVIDRSTLEIQDGICLTATLEILKAMAEGRGPQQAILALGYSGWAPGQLESEIQANGWLTGPADRSLIFDPDPGNLWHKALFSIGVDPAMLFTDAGHA